MTVTIDVPIGIGARLDGGPFDNAVVQGIPESDVVALVDETPDDVLSFAPLADVEADVASEIGSGEPVTVSTGSVDPDDRAGLITVPVPDGYYVVVETGGNPSGYDGSLLARRGPLRSQVESALGRHGGRIEPV